MAQNHPKKTTKPILTFLQLKCLTIMISLTLCGLVSIDGFGFLLFSYIYMQFLSKVAFPNDHPIKQRPVFFPNRKIFDLYMLLTAVVGLFLPMLYIFLGVLEGNKDGIKAVVPHVFLVASQVFMEGVSFSDRFSLPIGVFIPVFYNSYRLFTIKGWLVSEFLNDGKGGVWFGKAIAVANAVMWTYNLFGFLLPVFLPKSFKAYYG